MTEEESNLQELAVKEQPNTQNTSYDVAQIQEFLARKFIKKLVMEEISGINLIFDKTSGAITKYVLVSKRKETYDFEENFEDYEAQYIENAAAMGHFENDGIKEDEEFLFDKMQSVREAMERVNNKNEELGNKINFINELPESEEERNSRLAQLKLEIDAPDPNIVNTDKFSEIKHQYQELVKDTKIYTKLEKRQMLSDLPKPTYHECEEMEEFKKCQKLKAEYEAKETKKKNILKEKFFEQEFDIFIYDLVEEFTLNADETKKMVNCMAYGVIDPEQFNDVIYDDNGQAIKFRVGLKSDDIKNKLSFLHVNNQFIVRDFEKTPLVILDGMCEFEIEITPDRGIKVTVAPNLQNI